MKVYTRLTKRFLTGHLTGIVVTDVTEQVSISRASELVDRLPQGEVIETFTGSLAEVLAHDFIVE